MKIRVFAALLACSLAVAACNDVPVRSLTSTYQVQIQQLRDRGKPAKLDVLWVVDDSSSMGEEQQGLAASFKAFLAVFQQFTSIDMRLAVTTTNVCAKGLSTANRGKFVYHPSKEVSAKSGIRKMIPCNSDADCQKLSNGLPEPDRWFCNAVSVKDNWTCDFPPDIQAQGIPDRYPDGDYLFNFQNRCEYRCDADADPARCARVFGQPTGCLVTSPGSDESLMCGTADACDAEACLANPSLAGASDCGARCRGRECADICEEFLADQSLCQAKCSGSNSCIDVCESLSKIRPCANVCKSDPSCLQRCEDTLLDAQKCQLACEKPTPAECEATCGSGNMFFGQDFLCFMACNSPASCSDRCLAQFGQPSYRCLNVDDPGDVCVQAPPTAACPPQDAITGADPVEPGSLRMLDNSKADRWLKKWISGEWTGAADFDPAWKTLPTGDSPEEFAAREVARMKVFEQLFKCKATVGATDQVNCGLQEQGLRAAQMALDPNGENSKQARDFIRDDAYLLIVVVSDEDDCSAGERTVTGGAQSNLISGEWSGNKCGCARDANGCPAVGECNLSACSFNPDDLNPDRSCYLFPVSQVVNSLRSLKDDPAQVVFAAIVGGIVQGSVTSPSTAADDLSKIQSRFYDCRCNQKNAESRTLVTYACAGESGTAELGTRYGDVAKAFGSTYAKTLNICSPNGLETSLKEIADLVVPLLTQVCLPRPLEWSCQGKCEDTFADREKCVRSCSASDCFGTCQAEFAGLPGCADVCSSGEFVEVYKYDAKGNCAKLDEHGNCLPLTFMPNPSADGDYFLVPGSPSCPLFDPTLGERMENALQFREALEYSDRIEIVYRAGAFSCQDRCNRVFKDQDACVGMCGGTEIACLDTCTKTPSRCSYVCGTSTDACAQRCAANNPPPTSVNCVENCKN